MMDTLSILIHPSSPNSKESQMDKLKTGNLSDKVEFVAQIGSLLFGAVLTTVQIIKTIKGDDEKPLPAPAR